MEKEASKVKEKKQSLNQHKTQFNHQTKYNTHCVPSTPTQMTSSSLFNHLPLILYILTLSNLIVQSNAQWYKKYDAAKPPSYLQPPWASAPGFADAPLPVAPKPMAPPPPPPQGFQGAGRFYP